MDRKNGRTANENRTGGTPQSLTLFQQQESASLCRHVIETVGLYLASGIEMSITRAGIGNRAFWENLFLSEEEKRRQREAGPGERIEKKGILDDRWPTQKRNVPRNPCWNMDYQACAKYIAFGDQRENDDSVHFCRRFNVGLYAPPVEGTDEYSQFRAVAKKCVNVRNNYMHISRQSLMGITSQKVWDDIRRLEGLTEPLEKTQGKEGFLFQDLPNLKDFWSSVKSQCTNLVDTEPIQIDALGEELLCVEEMTGEERAVLISNLAYLGISEESGRIYEGMIYKEPDRRALMGRLRAVDPASYPLYSAVETGIAGKPGEQNSFEPAQRKTYTSEGLAVSKTVARLGRRELHELIERFNIVLDESVLLNSDGRNGVRDALIPAMKEIRAALSAEPGLDEEEKDRKRRKTFVKMDHASVSRLFRLFRESKPLSGEELQAWGEGAEEEQANRSALHGACKKGIGGALSRLKEEDCLKVSPSLSEDDAPCESLCRVAEKFPGMLFLVLTFSEAAARELGKVPTRNVVAARFVRCGMGEFALQIYDATGQNWVEIMGLDSDPTDPGRGNPSDDGGRAALRALEETVAELAADRPVERVCVGVSASQAPAVDEEHLDGVCLTVIGADGSKTEISVGARIGFGGEGVIYPVSSPESFAKSAVKIYKRANRTAGRLDKLKYMLANNPEIEGLCWPQALVCGDGEWIGFLMPLAEGEPLAYTVYNLGENATNIREKLGWDRTKLVEAAGNIAGVFDRMHRRGILMGDINPRNILATRDCRIWFVDCDSYQVGNFLCPVGMVQYIPPEVLREQGEGNIDYSYRRTEEHERYSLAVLLFEVLMLGKAPYVSRTNNAGDVKSAVLEGIFPYRFNDGEEDAEFEEEEEAEVRRRLERRGLLAPAGMWRMIWSNTTHKVKQAFYDAFKNGKRCPAWEWKRIMEQYAYEIGRDNASAELIPRSFKILKDDEAGCGVCADCGAEVRMLKKELEGLKKQGKPVYCHQHREERRLFSQFCEPAQCTKCRRIYSEKARYLVLPDFKPLCSDCGQEEVECAHCGTFFRMGSTRKGELEEQGKALYCGDCLYVATECSECSKQIRILRFKYEKLQRENREFWCDDCRQRRLCK